MRISLRALVTGIVITSSFATALGAAPTVSVVPPDFGVDATITPLGGAAVGAGVLDPSGASEVARVRARRGTRRLFFVDATNTGADTDPLILRSIVQAPSTAVMISDGAADITSEAARGTYQSAAVAADETHRFVIWMRPYTTGPFGDVRSVNLAVSCKDSLAPADAVIAKIKVRP